MKPLLKWGHYIAVVIFGFFTANGESQAAVKLSQVERYLNDLSTLQASFKQWDSAGALTTGKIYIQRPGLIRMNYDDPSKLVILADGETLFFADRGTGDLSYSPLGQTPATFLLEKTIDLQKDYQLENFTLDEGRVLVTLRRTGDNDFGTLTLVFRQSPSLQLVQWVITDPQNKQTIVRLEQIQEGRPLNARLFDSSIFKPSS